MQPMSLLRFKVSLDWILQLELYHVHSAALLERSRGNLELCTSRVESFLFIWVFTMGDDIAGTPEFCAWCVVGNLKYCVYRKRFLIYQRTKRQS